MPAVPRTIKWVGSSREDLREFPEEVRIGVGYALYLVQLGETPAHTKPMEGFKGTSVMKIAEDHDGNTFRAVYAAKFEEAIYVLHCFQKKSKSGIATPKNDLELIKRRYHRAEQEHQEWVKESKKS